MLDFKLSGAIYYDGLCRLFRFFVVLKRAFFVIDISSPNFYSREVERKGPVTLLARLCCSILSMVQLRSHVSTLRLSHPSTPSRSHESPGESSGQYGRPSPRVPQPKGQGGQHHRETTVSRMKSPRRTVPIPKPTRDDIG